MDWQPIETAPRTGDNIWLADPWNMRLAFWAHYGEWADFAKSEQTSGPRGLHFTPTHWMALPKPPTASTQQP